MYLKSIEIQGFKSFADRMLLEFHSGITGIVGPNGSGKSNIADAVRWVLGEQSAKQLRGARMEDIIFAGTQLRKKLGFAYVAITFDNSDHKLITPYDEVKVARRVYRSGESEYLLNGTVCRLRDVQELFLDTGIGKEGYSIIGQGQIEKILSGRPEERRELFDEAAGISKFKKRKQDALRNLEEEQKNLVRIEDIIAELEVQVEPLERQAKKAQEFLACREELKAQEIKQFLLESDELQTSLAQLEEKLGIAKTDYADAQKHYMTLGESYEQLLQREQEEKLAWSQYQQALSQAKVDRERHEGNSKVYEAQITAISERKKQNQERRETLSRQSEQRVQECRQHEEEIAQLCTKNAEALGRDQELNRQLAEIHETIKAKEKALEEKKNAVFEVKSEHVSLEAGIERYRTMLDQNAIKKADYKKQLLVKKSGEESIAKELSGYEKDLNDIVAQENKLQKKRVSVTAERRQQQEHLGQLNRELEEKQVSFHRENSRLESLRDIIERYDGFGNSIKRVMEQRHAGVLGVVSDVIRVKRQYESAMEAALGGSIQNIVTDTEETAKQMIGFLKENKFGRATFLPLAGLSARRSANAEVLSEEGAIGYGNTLAQTKPEFQKLADFLLGRTLVVDTIDHAIAIARKYKQSVRMVTLDGELINVGGAMSGGAFRSAGNLLGRRREMDELEKKTCKLQEEAKKLREEIDALHKAASERSAAFEDVDKRLQELSLEKNTVLMKKEQLLQKKKELAENFQSRQEEETELSVQSKALREAIEGLKSELCENEQQEKDCQAAIAVLDKELSEDRKAQRECSAQAEQLRLNNASVMQKLSFEKEHIRRLEHEAENAKEEEERLHNEYQKMLSEEEDLREKSRAEQELAQKEEKTIKEREISGTELLEQQQKTAQELKIVIGQREEVQKQLGSLDKECYRLGAQKQADEAKSHEMTEYMWKEYQVTFHNAKASVEWPTEPLSKIRKEVVQLKEKKTQLGDVNVNAIEDYRKVSERYELLKGQHHDVVAAEQALLKIIDDLDRQMQEQFKEKFQEICVQFDAVFKELFGGGQGMLELTDDGDVLTAGIRINAQPPGKKLQNMMQLSGGEKSLTAIALLFAIQNLKPSPFCLLDEIEAALDDANVKRYAKYLHKLTKDTQFLVITHRRGTMTAADVLYGITMQEKGVSTLVSVSLIEADLK